MERMSINGDCSSDVDNYHGTSYFGSKIQIPRSESEEDNDEV